ncbi:molybdopterin-dependent oxidoreductase [Vibrio chagasii]|nr:molybdopterin-dependent oxidoreductase [Vibrio chagasii]
MSTWSLYASPCLQPRSPEIPNETGKRGEGKFKRISWEEAYDEVAGTMQRLSKITVTTLST